MLNHIKNNSKCKNKSYKNSKRASLWRSDEGGWNPCGRLHSSSPRLDSLRNRLGTCVRVLESRGETDMEEKLLRVDHSPWGKHTAM